MYKKLVSIGVWTAFFILAAGQPSSAQSLNRQTLGGTLVVAVPVKDGLVACADKRLLNDQTGAFTDDLVKIRKANNYALFVATHTVGFLDKTTGKLAFNVFEIADRYTAQHNFDASQAFWDGLRNAFRTQLTAYLAKRKFKDWPETDLNNNRLLFNLVFFSVDTIAIRSFTLRVFYEKQPTPVIDIPNVVTELVRTPKLIGKGKDVINYLARNPSVAQDPSILRFDQGRFDVKKTATVDAVRFARRLFLIANMDIGLKSVSANCDCASLGFQRPFEWIDDAGIPIKK
jgi:hypothetical protein